MSYSLPQGHKIAGAVLDTAPSKEQEGKVAQGGSRGVLQQLNGEKKEQKEEGRKEGKIERKKKKEEKPRVPTHP
jgi:hypothetical protein